MRVTEAVQSRRSVRAFLDRPVPADVLREAVDLAARAPSGGNLQPWRIYVIAGPVLADLRDRVAGRLQHADPTERPEYAIYPPNLWEPHRTERFELGEAMYATLGIPREDKAGRLRQFAQNFEFFGAPAGLFCYIDRRMGPPQWSDLGMYLQTLMLLLRERGLDSCPQECWSVYPKTVASVLQPPAELMLFCGMAIGYADPDAPVNRLRSHRLPLDRFAEFRGFESS